MSERVYFRGTLSDAKRVTRELVAALTGKGPDRLGLTRSVFLSVGLAALSDIKDDFVRKSHGGMGEDGVTWQPLTPETIANRRVSDEDKKRDPAIRERENIRAAAYEKFKDRLLLSMPEKEAKQQARRLAGMEATRRTGKTKVQTLGERQVDILRDTGILINSLSPGVLSEGPYGDYTKPKKKGGDEQIMETLRNGVIVGTTVKYAATHQYGDASRGIPARPFLPTDRIPVVWQQRWGEVLEESVTIAAKQAYGAS